MSDDIEMTAYVVPAGLLSAEDVARLDEMRRVNEEFRKIYDAARRATYKDRIPREPDD